MVDAPFLFTQPYNMMKPLLGKYAQLVRFIDARELRSYFGPDAIPADFAERI
jgi:hypothetical protein